MAFGYDGSVRIKADLNHVAFDRGIAAMTGKVQSFGNTLKKVSGLVAAAFGRQASYSLGEAVSSATEGLKNENSILVDNAGVTKNVAKMWDDYAKSIGTTANNLTQAQKIQAEVNGILEETRFQTGDAAKLVTTYSGQVALLGYNFQNLKVQVGQALIPIAQAVLPGINAIIAALIKLATVFAQVTALLFGKSAEVKASSGIASSASDAAEATDSLADATANAGDASKQAAKDMKGVLAGIPSFKSALLGFAENFNEFHQKLYDALTFPHLKEKVQQLGSDLADAFNGLVAAVDWTLWGQQIGAGINLGLQFLTNFLLAAVKNPTMFMGRSISTATSKEVTQWQSM